VYTGLPAGSRFLDSQPLTGVPADRHLTESTALDDRGAHQHRAELSRTRPSFIVDGLGRYNPALAITQYRDLEAWLRDYDEVGRTGQSVMYRRHGTAAVRKR
jgi:hypothetical protein